MTTKDIMTFLAVMEEMEHGVAVRRGNDGFWYAAFIPQITPPVEVKWLVFENPLDAVRFNQSEEDAK